MRNKTLALLAILFSLSACGFHLRGQTPLPKALSTLYSVVENPYSQFSLSLKHGLQAAGAHFVDSAVASPYTLEISNVNFKQQWLSSSASGQVKQYNVIYSLNYIIRNRAGKVLVGPQTVTTTQNYTANDNQIQSSQNQLKNMQIDMGKTLVTLLLNRLYSQHMHGSLDNAADSKDR